MDVTIDREQAIGLCLDLEVASLEAAKPGLINFATSLGLNCGIYVSSPKNDCVPRSQGKSVSDIVSYTCEANFRPAEAIRRAVNLVGEMPRNVDKYVFVVTDRYRHKMQYHYGKGPMLSQTKGYGCNVVFVGVGSRYDRVSLEEIQRDNPCCLVAHVESPDKVGPEIQDIMGK